MIFISEIKDYIRNNLGQTNSYDGFSIQVYSGPVLQANISYKATVILKMEERTDKTMSFFLPKEDDKDTISYSLEFKQSDNETIFPMYDTFKDSKFIESALAGVLLLK